MITTDNLMRDSHDWDWVEHYAKLMSDRELVSYSRRLFNYLHALPDGTELEVRKLVKPENADLFAKLVCRYYFEKTIYLQFSADYTRIRKYNWDSDFPKSLKKEITL